MIRKKNGKCCQISILNLEIKGLATFGGKYETFGDFTLIQTFNLSALTNDEFGSSKIPELKRVSFQHAEKMLKEI